MTVLARRKLLCFLTHLIVLVTVVIEQPALAAPDEVRGTWLSTTGPDHIISGANTQNVFNDLRTIGINTVYVETWKNGFTNFPSPTLAEFTGGPDRSAFLISNSRDLVQETLISAHRNQMPFIGWFEYGFAAQFIGSGGTPSNPLATKSLNQGWLLQDPSGNFANSSNGFAWMNPAVPEVRQFLIDITLEAVNRYDLDGIQFDDRLAWPREFGWDATTAALYFAETGQSLPSNVNNSNFRAWRQSKVTLFAQELTQAVKQARPEVHVSVSPSITNFSDINYNAEWPEWVEAGLFDEYVPQAYRDNISSFNSIIGGQVAPFAPDELDKLVVGLRINGSGANTPFPDVQQMIERTRDEGAAGHSLWFSKGVRDDYPTQLLNFYDVANQGHAANPFFGADHRPEPIVGASARGNNWNFNLSEEGRYRLVARINGRWTEINVVHLDPGSHQFLVPGATGVELLVDRRSATSFLGDFNGDGNVDGHDFLTWQQNFGMTGAIPSQGDANADGTVDNLDLTRWQQNAGWMQTQHQSNAQVVPEPSTAILILAAALALIVLGRTVPVKFRNVFGAPRETEFQYVHLDR